MDRPNAARGVGCKTHVTQKAANSKHDPIPMPTEDEVANMDRPTRKKLFSRWLTRQDWAT